MPRLPKSHSLPSITLIEAPVVEREWQDIEVLHLREGDIVVDHGRVAKTEPGEVVVWVTFVSDEAVMYPDKRTPVFAFSRVKRG